MSQQTECTLQAQQYEQTTRQQGEQSFFEEAMVVLRVAQDLAFALGVGQQDTVGDRAR